MNTKRASKRPETHAQRPTPCSIAVNAEESPIGWLYKRRDKEGKTLISDSEFEAGERLRADFWFAQMTPRVTADWGGLGGGGGGSRRSAPGAGVEMRDHVIAAQERVRRALAAVGPELAGVLVDVCCHLKGLEQAEKQAGWPQRSGKVVLQLALTRLARHYGLDGGSRRSGVDARAGECPVQLRHWGTADYRPKIHAPEKALPDEPGSNA